MSDILERAAKAVGEVMYKRRRGGIMLPWNIHPYRDEALEYVKAAITTIREPSEAMLEEGFGVSGDERSRVLATWQAMIDEALAK